MLLARGTREVFDAESLVEEYLGPRKRGLRYAYPYYDGLVTNSDPRVICTGDLLAPSLLGTPVDTDRMATLTALLPLLQRQLDDIPTDLALADATPDVITAVAALYDPLDDPAVTDRDVKGSLIGKVLHRKRPALVPLFDSRIREFYRSEAVVQSAGGRRSWREYMELLIPAMRDDLASHAVEFQQLATLVPAAGPPLTALRLLDVVVWMSAAVV